MSIATVEFESYDESVKEVFDAVEARNAMADQKSILIKPNLINASPHPITTPPECCEAIIQYIRLFSDAHIVIGEGCGAEDLETDDVFEALGYHELASRLDVELIDLNNAPLIKMEIPDCPVFPEMYLPEMLFSHFVISVPVLKAHSLADITGAMKNMIGVAPPEHYSGRFGSWKKAMFHGDMHQAIVDLNRYRSPDLSLMDATIGLAEFHLGGALCEPPVNMIVAGFDAREVDRKAAVLLGFDWRDIPHLV